MKQNNRKNTWKAIVAVMLVMATLFSISTMVSADFVNEVFEEVCDMMSTSSSTSKHTHTVLCYELVIWVCSARGTECDLGHDGCQGGVHETQYLDYRCGY